MKCTEADPATEAARGIAPPRFSRAGRRTIAWVALAIAAATVAVHVHSYWWCETLTLCDVRLCVDEALASFQVPLTRLAADETAESNLVIYKRGPDSWQGVGSDAGKCTLRNWMMLGAGNTPHAMLADFGYWKGGWQSNSRPGPFVVVFVPVWFAGLGALAVFWLFYFGFIRFRLRTLLVLTAVVAGLLFLLTLRAADAETPAEATAPPVIDLEQLIGPLLPPEIRDAQR